MLRAVHQIVDDSPKVLRDYVILQLLGQDVVDQIHANLERAQEPWAIGLRSHVLIRSRFAEDRLAAAVQRGISQYVIVGAGLDTFGYRQPGWAEGLRIFELDHPASQANKLDRLKSSGITIPNNVALVPVDLETSSLSDGLLPAGFDSSKPAFFSCLGVMVYLAEETAEAIFRFVASQQPTSEIVFTFSRPKSDLSPQEALHQSRISVAVEAMGEPWRTFYDPDVLLKKLEVMGFSNITFLTPEEAEENYLKGRSDRLRAPRRGRIASAVV